MDLFKREAKVMLPPTLLKLHSSHHVKRASGHLKGSATNACHGERSKRPCLQSITRQGLQGFNGHMLVPSPNSSASSSMTTGLVPMPSLSKACNTTMAASLLSGDRMPPFFGAQVPHLQSKCSNARVEKLASGAKPSMSPPTTLTPRLKEEINCHSTPSSCK